MRVKLSFYLLTILYMSHPFFVRSVDLTACNTLGLACQADHVLDLKDVDQLPDVSACASGFAQVLVLGGGSNVVLSAHIVGLVIRVQLKGVVLVASRPDAWLIDVAGGENWHAFVTVAVNNGWDGLENLALIPGTVGAAPVQNIGAYGVELDSRIESVTAWNIPQAKMFTFKRTECGFNYRDSMFKRAAPGQWIIISVRFSLPRPWQPMLGYPDLSRHAVLSSLSLPQLRARDIFDAVCEIRRTKLPDPAVLGNAGSFFKNPVVSSEQFSALKKLFPQIVAYPQPDMHFKLAAGWLIEQCGLKGSRAGHVGVHDKQSLVLVNYGQATASDLLALANSIRQHVMNKFGVLLEIEPVVVTE